jgi:hypothetical protein
VPIIILFRYALPLVKEKAFIVAMKGGDLDEEFQKAELKYKSFIKKSTVYELAYKPIKLEKQEREKVSRYRITKIDFKLHFNFIHFFNEIYLTILFIVLVSSISFHKLKITQKKISENFSKSGEIY